MDILDDMGMSKLSAIFYFFFKVNYSFKRICEWKWSDATYEVCHM